MNSELTYESLDIWSQKKIPGTVGSKVVKVVRILR